MVTTNVLVSIEYMVGVGVNRPCSSCSLDRPFHPGALPGFYDDCKRRFSIRLWKQFTTVFDCLPLAAIVAGKVFCVHGGLSPGKQTPPVLAPE